MKDPLPKSVLLWKNFPLECYISCYGVTTIRLSWLRVIYHREQWGEHGCGGDWFCFTVCMMSKIHKWLDTFTCYVFITASGYACLHHHLSCASACKNCFLGWPYKNVCRFTLHLILLAPQQCFLGAPSSHVWNEVCVLLWLSASVMLETSLEDQN
jgi:hypothetical protein